MENKDKSCKTCKHLFVSVCLNAKANPSAKCYKHKYRYYEAK